MKIRVGYVSNSSSSSFVVIGKEVGNVFSGPFDLDFANKRYVMFGKGLYSDGIDYIVLNPELYKWIDEKKLLVDFEDGTIIEVIKEGVRHSDCLSIPDGIVGAKAWYIEASDHSSKTVDELREHYIECF